MCMLRFVTKCFFREKGLLSHCKISSLCFQKNLNKVILNSICYFPIESVFFCFCKFIYCVLIIILCVIEYKIVNNLPFIWDLYEIY